MNPCDLTEALSRYDIMLCSETLVSDMHHVSELLVPGFGLPVLLCRGGQIKIPGGRCTLPNEHAENVEKDALRCAVS